MNGSYARRPDRPIEGQYAPNCRRARQGGKLRRSGLDRGRKGHGQLKFLSELEQATVPEQKLLSNIDSSARLSALGPRSRSVGRGSLLCTAWISLLVQWGVGTGSERGRNWKRFDNQCDKVSSAGRFRRTGLNQDRPVEDARCYPRRPRTPPCSGPGATRPLSGFPLSMQAMMAFTAIAKIPPPGSLAVPVIGRVGCRFLQQHWWDCPFHQ